MFNNLRIFNTLIFMSTIIFGFSPKLLFCPGKERPAVSAQVGDLPHGGPIAIKSRDYIAMAMMKRSELGLPPIPANWRLIGKEVKDYVEEKIARFPEMYPDGCINCKNAFDPSIRCPNAIQKLHKNKKTGKPDNPYFYCQPCSDRHSAEQRLLGSPAHSWTASTAPTDLDQSAGPRRFDPTRDLPPRA